MNCCEVELTNRLYVCSFHLLVMFCPQCGTLSFPSPSGDINCTNYKCGYSGPANLTVKGVDTVSYRKKIKKQKNSKISLATQNNKYHAYDHEFDEYIHDEKQRKSSNSFN